MYLLVGGILLLALYYDITSARIPNRLMLGSLIVCLSYTLVRGGPPLLGKGIIGVIITFAILFPLYLLGAFGAGDIKLICVTASLLGVVSSLKILFISGLYLLAYRLVFTSVKLITKKDKSPSILEEGRASKVIFILNKGYALKRVKYSPFIIAGYLTLLVYLRL